MPNKNKSELIFTPTGAKRTESQQRTKVVVLPLPGLVVGQDDLEELILLRRLARERREAFFAKKKSIREMLDRGAAIEEGVHTARIVKVGGRRSRLEVY